MANPSRSPSASSTRPPRAEFVCAHRLLRDGDGRVVDVATVALKDRRRRFRR